MARTSRKLKGGAAGGPPPAQTIITRAQQQGLRNNQQARRTRRQERRERAEAIAAARTRRRNQRRDVVGAQAAGIERLNIADRTRQMREYRDYCEELRESYLRKHNEVEEATGMIADIKNAIDGIAVDVLANLNEMENIAQNSNDGNNLANSEGEDLGLQNVEDLLADLIGLIPAGEQTRSKLEDLQRMKNRQEEMTKARRANNEALTNKIGEVRTHVARIQMMGTGSSAGGAGGGAVLREQARNVRQLPVPPTTSPGANTGGVEGKKNVSKAKKLRNSFKKARGKN
jgi:hypothetical protein